LHLIKRGRSPITKFFLLIFPGGKNEKKKFCNRTSWYFVEDLVNVRIQVRVNAYTGEKISFAWSIMHKQSGTFSGSLAIVDLMIIMKMQIALYRRCSHDGM